jgi:membrane protein DedA with SNARE-associated domain
MLTSLAKHSFGAILLVVIIEEVGVPLPIPSDFLVIFAGTTADRSLPRLMLFYVALTMASGVGASGLYAIVRRGGRPLVERFGRYVHLGPEQLARAEALLTRSGWGGIVVGRATPGLRYATVIACGLLKVSYPRFVTATLVGSSVNVGAFLALGAIFGPTVLDRIHLPALAVRLLWVLPLAVGLPLLMVWGSSRSAHSADPSSRRVASAALLGSGRARNVPAAVHRLAVASGGHQRSLLRVRAAVPGSGWRLPAVAGTRHCAAHHRRIRTDLRLDRLLEA